MNFSRRGFLKGLAIGAGAAALPAFSKSALAAPNEKPAVLVVYMLGGYNSLFCSAQSLQGKFGVAAGNYTVLGNGLSVDNTYANSMSAFAKGHMATIGVRHGISSHDAARQNTISNGSRNYALMLANAMGGSAAIKAAFIGSNMFTAPKPPEGTTSLQTITDMKPTIDALGGGTPDPRMPDRTIAAGALGDAQQMSAGALADGTKSLSSMKEGYAASIDTLKAPAKTFSFTDLEQAYGLTAGKTAIANNDFKAKMAAAELMMLAGANVVMTVEANPGWDTHNDVTGTRVRNQMTSYILPPLNTFMNRMLQVADRNVVVVLMGEFARSLPGSDHQPNLSATVLGKYVKQGTTGRVDSNVGLAPGTPSSMGLWSYVASVAKSPANPFGSNPHALVL